jgi:hypothetical protein
MNRAELIEEMAEDITIIGYTRCVSTVDIIDWMLDDGSIDPATIAGLISFDQDVRIDCSYRVRQMVEREAINFFTTNDRGIEFIDDMVAERQAEEDEDAKERMKA